MSKTDIAVFNNQIKMNILDLVNEALRTGEVVVALGSVHIHFVSGCHNNSCRNSQFSCES